MQQEEDEKGVKMSYVRAPTPQENCDPSVLHTGTQNPIKIKKIKRAGESRGIIPVFSLF